VYQYKVKIQLNSCMLVDERFNGWKTDNNFILWSCVADFYPKLRNLRNFLLTKVKYFEEKNHWTHEFGFQQRLFYF